MGPLISLHIPLSPIHESLWIVVIGHRLGLFALAGRLGAGGVFSIRKGRTFESSPARHFRWFSRAGARPHCPPGHQPMVRSSTSSQLPEQILASSGSE